MRIGFWKSSDVDFGYLSSPLAFRNGKPIRMRLIHNKFFNKEKNRPFYVAFLDDDCDFDAGKFLGDEIEDAEKRPYYDEKSDCYYDENGNQLYTYDDIRHVISCVIRDVRCGYGEGDLIPEDYV